MGKPAEIEQRGVGLQMKVPFFRRDEMWGYGHIRLTGPGLG